MFIFAVIGAFVGIGLAASAVGPGRPDQF